MGPIDLLAVAFWPLIGLGIVLIIAAGRLPSRHRPARALVIAGLVAAAGPLGVLLIFYADYSELTRADQFSFIAILGSIVLVAAWHVEMQAIRRALCFLIGGAMFGMASWTFVGDYLVRREQIEGIVTGLHTERPGALGRRPPDPA
jgi:hypothetical protein